MTKTSPLNVTARRRAKLNRKDAGRGFSILRCLGFGLATVFASQSDARADSTWTGSVSQDWNNGSNWSNGFPGGTNAIVNTATGNYPIISATPTSGTPTDIFVGRNGGSTGRLDQTAGQAGAGDSNWLFVGASSGTGTFNLASTGATGGTLTGYGQGSGSFTAGRVNVGGGEYNGDGTGTLNINTTGTLVANNGNGVGFEVGVGGSSVGTVNLDSGTINDTGGEFWVGVAGQGTFNQSGGSVSSNQYFVVARGGGSTGVYNLTGGTVNAATNGGFAVMGSQQNNSGTLNVSGGTFNSTQGGMILGEGWGGSGATGTLNLSGGLVDLGTSTRGLNLGNYETGSGTLNLNGGTLRTGVISRGGNGAGGTAVVNLNGGTLQATQANGSFMTGLTSANVLAGGAKVDTNTFNITIGQSLLHGGTGTDGGLTKLGSGALTLGSANTFNGATSVQVGALTLAVLGELSDTSNLSMASSTTLNLNATSNTETVGSLTINGVSELPGTYTAAQLNVLGAASNTTFTSLGETLTVVGVAVPEPATWMVGAGCLGLAAFSLRRRIQSWLQQKRI